MKILLGIVIGAGIMFGGYAFAYGEIPYRAFIAADEEIVRFVDPDNGNICYMVGRTTIGSKNASISCVKP